MGTPALMSLMSDVNDLTTLALPAVATINTTFFLKTITMQNGDTLTGDVGNSGPTAVFRAAAVPEPTILAFLSLAFAGFCFARLYPRWTKKPRHARHADTDPRFRLGPAAKQRQDRL